MRVAEDCYPIQESWPDVAYYLIWESWTVSINKILEISQFIKTKTFIYGIS